MNAAARYSSPQSIGYLVRYAYRTFVRALAVELEAHAVTTGQWSVLRVLWQQEGLSQVELAQRMLVEKASLTSILADMAKRKLIVRTRNAEDRRKINISLTPQGRRLKDKLLPAGGRINKQATRGMSAAELAQFGSLLGRLTSNLES
jgi:DNA-binding MarR family transcriptional regulator